MIFLWSVAFLSRDRLPASGTQMQTFPISVACLSFFLRDPSGVALEPHPFLLCVISSLTLCMTFALSLEMTPSVLWVRGQWGKPNTAC